MFSLTKCIRILFLAVCFIVNGAPLHQPALAARFSHTTNSTLVQQKTVIGQVKDTSGEPLVSVSVYVKGKENAGVSTDFQGEFVLKGVSRGDVLIVSNVGFLTQEIVLEDQTILNITLESTSETLEEVVVVGYGVQKKQSVVGAISQVDSEDLIKSGYNNITSSMAGKLPGVTILQQSGEPGANAADITI